MIGKTLSHYKVTEKLGAGGMGEVYLAKDTTLGRDVAIKLLHSTFGDDAERLARFQREASLLASLNHPNIATIHGLEKDGDASFIVMELVPGEDLTARVKRGPLPVDECIDLCKQIAQSLAAAHKKGVVHRDLKPGNIRVTPDGVVKVLDFGLAKALDADPETNDVSQSPTIMSGGHTAAGVILGTAAYMSPEQARGKPLDERTDVWSFGCVLYECLIGDIPFKGETVTDMLAKILEREPDFDRLPANASAGLRMILRRCLEKDPRERWRNFNDIAILLDEAARLSEAAATPPTTSKGGKPWRMAAPLVVVAGLAGYFLAGLGRGDKPLDAPTTAAPAMTFEQLTIESGREVDPSFSPDGNFVIYTSGDTRSSDIFLQRVGGQKSINLTENSSASDYAGAYSPDGGQIAFRSERGGGGIFLMGSTGESVRRLTDQGHSPSWSPDGSQLVVTDEYNNNPYGRQMIASLHVVDVQSAQMTKIYDGDAVDPAWSPNGHRIAFWKVEDQFGGRRDLYTINADGTDPKPLTQDVYIDWYPVWSPDGEYIYYSSTRSGSMNLWRIAVDEKSGEARGEPEPVTTPTSECGQFTISGDGKSIAYISVKPGAKIDRLDLDLAADRAEPPTTIVGASLRPADPNVSPDNEWIVFRSAGATEDLMLCRVDGTAMRKLTDDIYKDRGPSWSPDGERIIWYSDRSGRYDVHSIRKDGSGLQQVTKTEGRSLWYPLYSHAGTRIAGTNETGGAIIDVSGALPVLTEDGGESLGFPAEGRVAWIFGWSRDDSQLLCGVFNPQRSVMEGIALYDVAAKTFTRVGPQDEMANAAWLPDGRIIVTGLDGLSILDPRSGKEKIVADISPSQLGFGQVSVFPDGSAFLPGFGRNESDIWLAKIGD